MNAKDVVKAMDQIYEHHKGDGEVLHIKMEELLLEQVPVSVQEKYKEIRTRTRWWYA